MTNMIKYTKDHEWISGPNEDGHYKIGISAFAARELGDIVYVDVEYGTGDSIEKDEVFGSIEAVKTVSDLFMPVECTIVDVNEDLEDVPESVNESPLESWILKVELRNESDLTLLISEENYLKEYQ